jgi:hypothetical protein
MHARVGCLWIIAATALVMPNSAWAGAITVTAQGSDGVSGFDTTSTLPADLSQGYSVGLYSTDLHGNLPGPSRIDSDFQLRLSFDVAGSNVPLADQPSLLVTGHTTGSGNYTSSYDYQDYFSGSGTIAQTSNWTPNPVISQAILDQLAGLGQFAIFGGGSRDYDDDGTFSTLTVSASPPGTPMPIPEPSTLAVFLTTLAVVTAVRCRRRASHPNDRSIRGSTCRMTCSGRSGEERNPWSESG